MQQRSVVDDQYPARDSEEHRYGGSFRDETTANGVRKNQLIDGISPFLPVPIQALARRDRPSSWTCIRSGKPCPHELLPSLDADNSRVNRGEGGLESLFSLPAASPIPTLKISETEYRAASRSNFEWRLQPPRQI